MAEFFGAFNPKNSVLVLALIAYVVEITVFAGVYTLLYWGDPQRFAFNSDVLSAQVVKVSNDFAQRAGHARTLSSMYAALAVVPVQVADDSLHAAMRRGLSHGRASLVASNYVFRLRVGTLPSGPSPLVTVRTLNVIGSDAAGREIDSCDLELHIGRAPGDAGRQLLGRWTGDRARADARRGQLTPPVPTTVANRAHITRGVGVAGVPVSQRRDSVHGWVRRHRS